MLSSGLGELGVIALLGLLVLAPGVVAIVFIVRSARRDPPSQE